MFIYKYISPFIGDGEETEVEAETTEVKKPETVTKVKLDDGTQKYVNSLIAEEKRQGKQKLDKAITALETIKNQAGTTAAERDRLNEKIEELNNQYATERELTAKELGKKEKETNKKIKDLESESQKWKELFHKSTITRSIKDAARVKGQEAHNPEHIVSELFPKTRLVEELDEEGKPTGEYVAKTKLRSSKDGKSQVLEMTVTEAVKFMSEQDEHAPLFNSGVSGGLGGHNKPSNKGGGVDNPNEPPTDPEQYRIWRKKHSVALGGKRSSSN